MKSIIALTRCQRMERVGSSYVYYFHFVGFYAGNKVDRIMSLSDRKKFEIGEDYILSMDSVGFEGGTLNVQITRYKKVQEVELYQEELGHKN